MHLRAFGLWGSPVPAHIPRATVLRRLGYLPEDWAGRDLGYPGVPTIAWVSLVVPHEEWATLAKEENDFVRLPDLHMCITHESPMIDIYIYIYIYIYNSFSPYKRSSAGLFPVKPAQGSVKLQKMSMARLTSSI
jgi:hypothetical protein